MLPNTFYRLNAIPIKILIDIFHRNRKKYYHKIRMDSQ